MQLHAHVLDLVCRPGVGMVCVRRVLNCVLAYEPVSVCDHPEVTVRG